MIIPATSVSLKPAPNAALMHSDMMKAKLAPSRSGVVMMAHGYKPKKFQNANSMNKFKMHEKNIQQMTELQQDMMPTAGDNFNIGSNDNTSQALLKFKMEQGMDILSKLSD